MPKIALLTAIGGPIELAEFPLTTPAPGTAALKLRMAGICGSDLHIFRGELPLFYPFAMGHEMVCEIAELGEGLTTDATGKPLAVGDRVVTPYFWTCGQCHACARGRPYACQNLMAGEFRTHDQAPHFVGAHGEYYYTTRRQPLYKVPEDL
ncbi:MAG: alcohol dehydrogenase catalytic domain-containing protein, partial [Mycobacterium sp.]|nr:alcohol dehydrogenase catalytic domain-containing protein [Mycobacterium sp.]